MSEAPQHSQAFRLRRFLNWFPMGLTYAFLYMGRYNLTVSKNALGDLMTKEDFGVIFAAGTFTYAFAFLINGPLVDKIGGKRGILIGAFGSAVANLIMGFYIATMTGGAVCETAPNLRLVFSLLYAMNMYFQSYGAVAIVKVNAHWFHVRERGGFSGIFGTMISSGIFFAFTVNGWILDAVQSGPSDFGATKWVFFAPSAVLFIMFAVETFLLRDRPGLAGHTDFDTGDASSGEEDVKVNVFQVIKRIFTNPIIITVALIEFCTGVLRNGVMHWYPIYAKEVLSLPGHHYMRYGDVGLMWMAVGIGVAVAVALFFAATRSSGKRKGWLFASGGLCAVGPFILGGWGGILFVAGVIGANVAGWVSDLFFQSRRAPTAGLLYLGCAVAAIGIFFTLGTTTDHVAWSKISWPKDGWGKALLYEHPGEDRFAVSSAGPDGEAGTADDVRLTEALLSLEGAALTAHLGALDEKTAKTERALRGLRERLATAIGDSSAPVDHERAIALYDRRFSLLPGDRILTIAGKAVADWEEVGKAVASVPAACECDTRWDTKNHTCSSTPEETRDGLVLSRGIIHVAVERGEERLALELADPKPKMYAGDHRSLAAGPVLPLSPLWLGLIVFVVSLCVIGTHGLLSGTATMDFGGRKGAATAVGMIDGFVYLGTGVQSLSLGYLTTNVGWHAWPIFLFPFAIAGFVLLLRIWKVVPKGKGGH